MRNAFYPALVVGLLTCTAARAESVCTNPEDDPPGPDATVACYSDTGCALAESFGAEPNQGL